MNDEDAFQSWLDEHPDDAHCRLVFADWLDERGDERAAGYRALGRNRLRPYVPAVDSPSGPPGDSLCPWFTREDWFSTGAYSVPGCKLPVDWFDAIEIDGRSRQFAPDHGLRTQAERAEVEDAAARAFALLPAARQAALLNPEPVGA